MQRKLKFRPVVTRIKLNPEQAVLSCACYTTGLRAIFIASAGRTSNSLNNPRYCFYSVMTGKINDLGLGAGIYGYVADGSGTVSS